MNKGFFGNLQGPFEQGFNIMNTIKAKHETDQTEVDYLSKVGIHFVANHKFDIQGNATPLLYINLDSKIDNIDWSNPLVFQIGTTGILEFQDVQIIAMSFAQGAQDIAYIDYQYQNKNK